MGNASYRRPVTRALFVSAALTAMTVLGGCNIEGDSPTAKALKPISDKMLSDIAEKNMAKDSPILVRIFKEESELELWKEDRSGKFALLKTYPICRWSGELGPKIKEGDRQAPEGFYAITPGQMNPNSAYYLAFNLGYPNAFDKAHGRSGAHLMVHGDCSSRGCYSMTDEQIGEIYALARESFFGGQKSFQVQAYPFRMTAQNMAKHRNNPHLAFWKMLKQGNDHFEVTRLEPKVDVCERKYVFDAAQPADATRPLKFTPAGACPVFEVPEEIASAVAEKQSRDETQFAELSRAGIATAPIRTGRDGGMNPVFLAALQPPDTNAEGPVRVLSLQQPAPGTVPAHAVPPGAGATAEVAVVAPDPQIPTSSAPPPASTKVASASPGGSNFFGNLFSSSTDGSAARKETATKAAKPSEGMFDRLTRFVGLRGSDTSTAATTSATAAKAKPAPASKATQTAAATKRNESAPRPSAGVPIVTTAKAAPAPAPTLAAAAAPKPQPLDEPVRTASGAPTATMPGAQPVLQGSSFDSRWGGFR